MPLQEVQNLRGCLASLVAQMVKNLPANAGDIRDDGLIPGLGLDIEQTGSKLGKEYVKAVYCHHAYLTYMQCTSCKIQG